MALLIFFVVLLSFVACALAGTIPAGMVSLDNGLAGRIVGGTPTQISAFPWQISLQRSGSHSCGGSIYSTKIIVTAAHCLQSVSASVLRIRAGSSYWNSGGVVISVSSFKNHEGYNKNTYANDIAVIKLSSSLSYSSTTKAIGLATSAPSNGASAAVSGWGTLKSGSSSIPSQLQYVDVSIISESRCASSTYSYGSSVKSGMICAAASGKDACQGDSGGPLVSGGVLVGVVSWGKGCALAKYPGVYADIATFRSWVVSTANSI
ncbi:trypsin alpha-like isoform X1 [Ceratitis capitata]|uniref:trypsin alpha-like isoform X1 n=1 Tax=Ceratitis capitata TaxID=7213 RepID=UPI000C6C8327|nr:trypsin alpha-like isoform X1 [Ceratitis capitata]